MSARATLRIRAAERFGALVFALVFTALSAGNAAAAHLEDVLSDLAAGARGVRSIESSFTQTRYVSFMDEKLVSNGFFVFTAPDRLIWQYDTPSVFRLEYDGGKASFHSEVGGRASSSGGNSREESLAATVAAQIVPWISMDLERIKKDYDIELESDAPLSLKLTPKRGQASSMEFLRLVFAPNRRDVRQVYMQEADGDYTVIEFHDSRREE